MQCPVREGVFHFIFHFHYQSGESINARRIREITWLSPLMPWCLSLSLLIIFSLSLHPMLFYLLVFCLPSLCVLSNSHCPSLSISLCHSCVSAIFSGLCLQWHGPILLPTLFQPLFFFNISPCMVFPMSPPRWISMTGRGPEGPVGQPVHSY